jgi:3-dehydroquinate synthase
MSTSLLSQKIEIDTVARQRFAVEYHFPVYFTRDLFHQDNKVLLEAVNRVEPGQRHRIMFVIDQNVDVKNPGLRIAVRRYVSQHPSSFEMAAEPLPVAGGEASKNDINYVVELLAEINRARLDRHSFIAIIGGGAVLDMACFAAALAHRGIRAIRIPTTVLSQADSGVGVKNGVNFFGKKNFIGTFVPPFAVINDSRFIETLSLRDKIAGMAESVKVALIRDRWFFEFLEANVGGLADGDPELLALQIRHCAELHMRHIRSSGDPFELGSARPLDFGHWVAHKLESMTQNQLRHGEAVAIGMAVDLIYSAKARFLPASDLDRALNLLASLGLPLWHDALLQSDRDGRHIVLQGLQEFREHLGGCLHITLVRQIGDGFEVTEMDKRLVVESIETLRRRFASPLHRKLEADPLSTANPAIG